MKNRQDTDEIVRQTFTRLSFGVKETDNWGCYGEFDGASDPYSFKVVITGAWSDGRSQLRASVITSTRPTPSFNA